MKTKLRKTYNLIIGIIIVLMTFGFLYDQIFNRNDLKSVLEFFPLVSESKGFNLNITFILFLVFVNYLIESMKWQFFIGKLEKISLLNAYKAILTGTSISMFMPNRVGDYLGRVFILKKADRIRAILATIVGSMSQLIATILFGAASLALAYPQFVNMDEKLNRWMYAGLLILLVSITVLLVFAYLNFGIVSSLIKKISGKGYKKIKKYADVFSIYNASDLLYVLILSLVRYFVFSFQYVLLLWLFNIEISYLNAMMLIGLVYLGLTIIPTIALTELGVRGSVSIFVFSYYFQSVGYTNPQMELAVVSASSTLWLINVILPALVGTIFIFNLKFFRKTNNNAGLD